MNISPYHFTFSVKDASINIHTFDQYEVRGDSSLLILQAIVAEIPQVFEGRSGFVYYADFPPDPSFYSKADLRFCSTKRFGCKNDFLPFPCPNAVAWPQIGLADSNSLLLDLLDYSSQPECDKLFWIGANTHPSRVLLASLSMQHPDVLDAEIMSWQADGSGRSVSTGRQVSLWDHRRFKYLVDCPGHGYSGRLKWLLASGRPVFVVERDFVEPWHDRLEPWKHYVPVSSDLSDLLENYQRLEHDPNLYTEISTAAKQFSRENLVMDKQILSTARHVVNISRQHL